MAHMLILYYSGFGHIEQMAEAIAMCAREAGAETDVKNVPETMAEEIARAAHVKHAIILVTGTRFGRISSQMAAFLDQTGGLWTSGALVGKVGSAFTCSASQHGGQETTLFALITNLLHFGMTIVGLDYGFAGQMGDDAVWGGAPYGATTLHAPNEARQPDEVDLAGARYLGAPVARAAASVAA